MPTIPGPRGVLIIWHSRTGLAERLSRYLEQGARQVTQEMMQSHDTNTNSNLNSITHTNYSNLVQRIRARDVTSIETITSRAGFIFCAPENLASLSGEMKEFFDQYYYPGLGQSQNPLLLGRPYGIVVAGGSDGINAAKQVDRICTGWRLKNVLQKQEIITINNRNNNSISNSESLDNDSEPESDSEESLSKSKSETVPGGPGSLIIRNGLEQTAENILRPGKEKMIENDVYIQKKCIELGGLLAAQTIINYDDIE